MVVQCPNCQTKFRIADDKVTDKGVRVRCTSCKNVFQVKKSGTEQAASQDPSGMTQEMQAISLGPVPARPASLPSLPPLSRPPAARPATTVPPAQRPLAAAPSPPASQPSMPKPASAPSVAAARAATIPPAARPVSSGALPRSPAPSQPGRAAAAQAPAALSTPPPSSSSAASAPGSIGRRRPSAFALEENPRLPGAAAASRPRASADDLFGMDELTGERSALPGSPLSSNPNLSRLPRPPPPPPPADAAEDPASRPGEPAADAAAPGATGGEVDTGSAVKLGAIKTMRRDPFDGLDLAESSAPISGDLGTGSAAEAEPRVASAPLDQSLQRPVQRELVAVLLTGAIGIALALALAAVTQFANRGPAWLRNVPEEPLVATQIASGLYDIAGEKPLFFVRGRVQNRGAATVGPVHVVADLIGANGSLARAESVAGSEPSPEDVHALRTAEEAEALVKKLALAGADKKLAPGESLPFFALIPDPPAEAESDELRLRVETRETH